MLLFVLLSTSRVVNHKALTTVSDSFAAQLIFTHCLGVYYFVWEYTTADTLFIFEKSDETGRRDEMTPRVSCPRDYCRLLSPGSDRAMVLEVATPTRVQQGAILTLAAVLVAAGVGGGQWFMDADYIVYGASVRSAVCSNLILF